MSGGGRWSNERASETAEVGRRRSGGQGVCAVADGGKAEAMTASKRRRDRRMEGLGRDKSGELLRGGVAVFSQIVGG